MKRTRCILAALGCALLLGACSGGGGDEAADVTAVVDRHAAELVRIEGVSAVAAGRQVTGRPCVDIWVVALTDSLRAALPTELEGHPVEIRLGGEFVPVADSGDS